MGWRLLNADRAGQAKNNGSPLPVDPAFSVRSVRSALKKAMLIFAYSFLGIVGKNCGVTRPFVFCSKAYAYLISVGSLQAAPKKNIPAACVVAATAC